MYNDSMRCVLQLWILALFARGAWAGTDVTLKAELGPGYDTNTTRIQTGENPDKPKDSEREQQVHRLNPKPVSAGFTQFLAGGRLRLSFSHASISLDYDAGLRLFIFEEEAQKANEFVHKADFNGVLPSSCGTFSLQGNYYDMFQKVSLQDVRFGSGSLRYSDKWNWFRPIIQVGYRALEYKPSPSFVFHGPSAGIGFQGFWVQQKDGDVSDWHISLFYNFAYRNQQPFGNHKRADDLYQNSWNHAIRAQVNYFGHANVTLWYVFEYNDSASDQGAYGRHNLGLKFTSNLIWNVFITVIGNFQISHYFEPLLISSQLNFDEENRTKLVLQFSYDIKEFIAVLLRYGIYANESHSQSNPSLLEAVDSNSDTQTVVLSDYLRQMMYAGVRFEFDF